MAKTETTVKGYVYTVTSPNGGTVTDAEGKLSKTVDAGDQITVTAPSDSLTCDDDDAVICKANFKCPLLALRMLGQGANALPAGYTPLDFLGAPQGGVGIDLNYVPSESTGFSTDFELLSTRQYQHVLSAAEPYYNAAGTLQYRAVLFTPHYNGAGYTSFTVKYLTAADSWRWYNFGTITNVRRQAFFNWKNDSLLKMSNGQSAEMPQGLVQREGVQTWLFALPMDGNQSMMGRVYAAAISEGARIVRNYVPAIDREGRCCMFDTIGRRAYHNSLSGTIAAGVGTVAQLTTLLRNLPATGGELTLSLPHEASIDRLAQAALERARANGWTLTLQYAEAEVPAGYRRLEFLESTGTQYIDTGYVPDNESGILLDQEKLSMGDFIPMGCRNDNNNTRFYAFRTICAAEGNKSGYGWGGWVAVNAVIGRQTTKLNFMNSRKVEGGGSSVNLSELPFVPEQPIYMFAANIGGAPNLIWSGRIYEAVISQGDSLAMSFVPCISPDGKLGMYNRVDGTLKENAGAGAFIAGLATVDDVRKLWLPETNGELTVSVPSDTPDSAVEQLRKNNPTWQIAIQYRKDNEN